MSARDIDFTIFRPENLGIAPQTGTNITETWERFVRLIPMSPVETDDKASAGGFVMAKLRDGIRRNANVIHVSAIGLDYDAGAVSLAQAHTALSSVCHVVYPTHSATPDFHKWRAIAPLDRDATREEHDKIRPVIVAQLETAGIVLDRGAKDACRLWYLPAIKPGATYEVLHGDGPSLCVDELIAIAKDMADDREAARRNRPAPPAPANIGRHDVYVRAAIVKAGNAVAGATPGERHYQVSREAYCLARFGLSADEIASALVPAAVHAMGEGRRSEIERTIRDAVKSRLS